MTKAEEQFAKHIDKDLTSEDLRQLYLEGSWDTDEVKAIRSLRSTLTGYQLKAFEFAEWLFYGPRGTGRTYFLVILAVCKALELPNQWVTVYDHHSISPLHHSFLKDMLWHILKKVPIYIKFDVRTYRGYLDIKYIRENKDAN